MNFATADLCDAHEGEIQVGQPLFRSYGALTRFAGQAVTLRVHNDNSLVRAALEGPGSGKVLVVDGGASTECALVGDQLARLAIANGWSGIIVHGCIRDSAVIATMPISIKALATCPRKSVKKGQGERDVTLAFAGLTVAPHQFVYSDEDGIVVARRSLL